MAMVDNDEIRNIKVLKVFMIAITLFGVVFAYSGVKGYQDKEMLFKRGITAGSVVTDKDSHRGRKGRRSYYLTVEFRGVQNELYKQRMKCSSKLYYNTDTGSPLEIVYDPENTANLCTANSLTRQNQSQYIVLTIIGIVISAAGLIVFFIIGKKPGKS